MLIILNHNILFIKKEIIIKRVAAQPTISRVFIFFKILSEKMSGRPGSNRRQLAWKANALPTELLPQNKWGEQDSNLRR